jgi:Kdo2-lipid IVA lauroyltransferase/acyltransferase
MFGQMVLAAGQVHFHTSFTPSTGADRQGQTRFFQVKRPQGASWRGEEKASYMKLPLNGMKILSALVQPIKYRALLALIWLIRSLPYPIVLNFFRSLGVIVWLADPFHRKVARIQMQAALGLTRVWYIVLKVFVNQVEIVVDTIRYAFMSDEEIRSRIVVEGKEHMDEALSSGRGVMMITGHIGNWEILGHIPKVLGAPFCIMADVRKDPQLEAIVSDIRVRCGATILPPTGTFHMLIGELNKGKTIGMVIDMRGDQKGDLLCDVLGMPAPTKSAPAFIALKGNALVVPVYTIKKRGTYHWYFSKAVDAAQFGEGDAAVQKLSDFMQSWVASVVREHPDQWFWLYTRWLKRSDMRRVIKNKLDLKGYVRAHAEKNRMVKPVDNSGFMNPAA